MSTRIFVYRFKVWCQTDNVYEYTWSQYTPTACPRNASHSIDLGKTNYVQQIEAIAITSNDSPYKYKKHAIIADTTTGNITITLKNNDRVIWPILIIKPVAANIVTLDPFSSELIDGSMTIEMTGIVTRVAESDGTSWTTIIDHLYKQTFNEVEVERMSNITSGDQKGDIMVDDGKQLSYLSIGNNNEFLQVDQTAPEGIKWSNLETITQTLTNKTINAASNTITNISNIEIKAAAAIDASKIADGTVSNAKFQYLNAVTSDIQTQLNGKAATSHNHAASEITSGTLSVARGGLGVGTLASGKILQGGGTLAVTATLDAPVGAIVGTSDVQTLTNKTINAATNTITNISNLEIKAAAAIDASKIADGTVSNVEFQYLNAVTGDIQTQLNGKAASSHNHAASEITSGTLSVARGGLGVATLASGKILQGAGTLAVTATLDAPVGAIVGTSDTQTLTNKTINAANNTITNISNLEIKTAAAIDAAKIADGSVSNAEFQFLDGATSNLQTQLNGKAATSHNHAAGEITSGTLSVARGGLGVGTLASGKILQGAGTLAVTATLDAPIGAIVGISDVQTLTNKTINAANNTITNISNLEIKAAAGIDAAKIADGSVSNAEFQYLNAVTSDIQTQLNGKAATSHDHAASEITSGTLSVARGGLGVGTLVSGKILQGAGTLAVTATLDAPVGAIVGTSDVQTLTNKTINAATNTITNISNLEIKAAAAIDAAKIADGTVSNAEFQFLDGATSNLQTQLNSKAATSHTHAASEITSGTLSVARGGLGVGTLASGKILQGAGTLAVTATLDAPVGVIVGTSDTQTLTNKTINVATNTITNISNLEIKAAAAIDATKIADGSVSNAEFQFLDGATSNLQTQLNGKAAASHAHAASEITSGTLSVAQGGIGVATLASGKILQGAGTLAVTATLDAPTGGIVGTSDTQTLTNKTLTNASNNIAAKSLHSATTVIDISSATAPTSGQILTATSSTTATWQTVDTGASIFGSQYYYQASDTESTTTSTTLQTKTTLTTDSLPSGTYRLGYSFEISNAINAVLSEVQVFLDDVAVGITIFEADDDFHSLSGFVHQSLSGIKTATIKHRIQTKYSGTSKIRRARLELYRVS